MDMSFPPLLHPLFRHDLLFFEDLIVRYRWIVATLSTVYLRFHYVIDVLAGILLAVLCLVLERMTTARWKQL